MHGIGKMGVDMDNAIRTMVSDLKTPKRWRKRKAKRDPVASVVSSEAPNDISKVKADSGAQGLQIDKKGNEKTKVVQDGGPVHKEIYETLDLVPINDVSFKLK